MKVYEKISYERITDFDFVDGLLTKRKIIVCILVDEQQGIISELTSYAYDKNAQSYYTCYVKDKKVLKDSIITETLYPFYNFKRDAPKKFADPIDIWDDYQNVVDYYQAISDITRTKEFLTSTTHFEFYVSKGVGDISSFGGPLEVEFVKEWMLEKGYYIP